MERRHVYLLVSRIVCAALACASYAIKPLPSPDNPMLMTFVIVKASVFFEMIVGLIFVAGHVACLNNLLGLEPHNYCSYGFIFAESMLAFFQWGSAGAAFGVMIDHRYNQACVGPHEDLCRRQIISSGLALLAGCLGIANAVVLLVARMSSNQPRFLDMIRAWL